MKAPLRFARPRRNRVRGSEPACHLSDGKLQGLRGKGPAATDVLQSSVEGSADPKLRQGCPRDCDHMAPIIDLLQETTRPPLQ